MQQCRPVIEPFNSDFQALEKSARSGAPGRRIDGREPAPVALAQSPSRGQHVSEKSTSGQVSPWLNCCQQVNSVIVIL